MNPDSSGTRECLMNTSEKTLVTIATYNEVENLPSLVEEIFRFAPDVEILVIDDNSPDGTGCWCDAKATEDPRVHCLHRAEKSGVGTAIVAGMKYAIGHGYRYLLNIDADFSHPPMYLPAMIAGMESAGGPPIDVMIGSRYIPGGEVEGWPWRRRVMSRCINLCARWLLALEPKDCSGGYRCYRVAALAKLDLESIESRGYSFQEEVLWRLKRTGAHFDEIPIIFLERQRGKTKLNSWEALNALRIIFALSLQRLFRRP